MSQELLSALARVKVAFQQKSIMVAIDPYEEFKKRSPSYQKRKAEINESRMEEGDMCCLCEQTFIETYGRPLACEECGGDGVLDCTCPICGDPDCKSNLGCQTGDGQ